MSREGLIALYDNVIGHTEADAAESEERAYGGFVRAQKGKLVEDMASHIVRLAWQDVGGADKRLSFGDVKAYQVHVSDAYVAALPRHVREYVSKTKNQHSYRAHVDRHVFIDGRFVVGIECKAYTENAMLKRILVDFSLLKSLHSSLICCLFQLESMLGGQYARPLASPQFGSPRSHVLMSFFPNVNLKIITLLEGKRKVDRPIHKKKFFKPLTMACVDHAIEQVGGLLERLHESRKLSDERSA